MTESVHIDDIAKGLAATIVWLPQRRSLFCPACKSFADLYHRHEHIHRATGVTCPRCKMRMLDAPEGSFELSHEVAFARLHLSRKLRRFMETSPRSIGTVVFASPATIIEVERIRVGKKGGLNGGAIALRDEGNGDRVVASYKRENKQIGWRVYAIATGNISLRINGDAWVILGERLTPKQED